MPPNQEKLLVVWDKPHVTLRPHKANQFTPDRRGGRAQQFLFCKRGVFRSFSFVLFEDGGMWVVVADSVQFSKLFLVKAPSVFVARCKRPSFACRGEAALALKGVSFEKSAVAAFSHLFFFFFLLFSKIAQER